MDWHSSTLTSALKIQSMFRLDSKCIASVFYCLAESLDTANYRMFHCKGVILLDGLPLKYASFRKNTAPFVIIEIQNWFKLTVLMPLRF
jgi:hypothetical protein